MVSNPDGSAPVGAVAANDNFNCAIFYIDENNLGGFDVQLLENDDKLRFTSLDDGMCFSSFS